MAKPTGISGFFVVKIDDQGHVSGQFEQIVYSPEKVEVEKQIAVSFIASMNKHGGESFFLSNPRPNQENDLDFSVDSDKGQAYLELMEIAPLKGPYAKAPASYRPYELGQAILGGIRSKSKHYGTSKGDNIFLLIYATHWTFTPSDLTLACLRYWLAREQHVFRAIFAFYLLDSIEGAPYWLFPYPPDLLGSFDPETVRNNVCFNLDPRKFKVRSRSDL